MLAEIIGAMKDGLLKNLGNYSLEEIFSGAGVVISGKCFQTLAEKSTYDGTHYD